MGILTEYDEPAFLYATIPKTSSRRLENWELESPEGPFPQMSASCCWGSADTLAGAVS